MQSSDLIGRERERRALEELMAAGTTGPSVLVLVGHQGSGRTSLVGLACDLAASVGRRGLTVDGVPGEERIPLAGLSQLLLPFIPQVESLPTAHRLALERPLGLASRDESFDLVATGMAVIALMTQRPEAAPLFVAVDDADRVDAETLSVLAFVAKRMDRQRAVLLLTAEPARVPAQFERSAPLLQIRSLSESESRLVLGRPGLELSGSMSQQVVDQAAGSPLALLETAAGAIQRGPDTRPLREPLRMGSVIEDRVMARVRRLPEKTRERLVDAAVAESYSWFATGSAPALRDGLTLLSPAEADGIVRIDHTGVTFVHPAFWIAIYHSTPYNERVLSHRRLAEALADSPVQRAWHLARATQNPDEVVAGMLEESARGIRAPFGRLDAALMLERAAELSEDTETSARRLLAAAQTAAPTGELVWLDELTARAMENTRDPQLRMQITTLVAWAAAARGRFSSAMATLSRAATETVDTAPEAAWEILSIAAAYGYQSGNRATQTQMVGVAARLAANGMPATVQQEARSVWVGSYLEPGRGTQSRVERLRRLIEEGPTDEPSLSRLAGAAWLDDESESALDLANAAYDRLVDQGAFAAAANIGPIRAATAWDLGRWDDALLFGSHASQVAEAAGGGMLRATDDIIAGLVFAARGDRSAVKDRALSALTIVERDECRSVAARVEQALGLDALASGDYADAFAHFSQLFREDGTPLHWHISYFGVADLAASALRGGSLDAGRLLLARILDRMPPEPAVRLRRLVLRARALLAESDDDARRFFEEATSDPAGCHWPFERAQLLLDYGSWLRRQRRVSEAKPLLSQAHDVFHSLGASPWTARAASELRASHVDVRTRSGSLDELTAQQREIVLLAGRGLTNREIAEKMYLSPRTVASHLYRSFPKLGIRDRWQLRDVIDQRGQDGENSPETTSVT
jgi:DNA-binding CsgD family transcriptional regulator